MARTWHPGCDLRRFVIEEFSIAELLDDPIAHLLMKSDGVDRHTLEPLLIHQIARSQQVSTWRRSSPSVTPDKGPARWQI
jgi:hypothetical protein